MYFGQTRPMTVYNRQIRYLDYMESGERTKGAGFVKIERQDDKCSISLQISGLYRKDRLVRPLILLGQSGEHELCKLQLADGGIKLYLDQLDCANLDGQGMRYEEWIGIRVPLSENKEVCCMWNTEQTVSALRKKAQEPEIFVPLQEMVPWVEEAPVKSEPPISDTKTEIEQERAVILDSKWEQLWAIYPHTFPFSDDREYLSMGPSDFVVLTENHYKLANNSFLLHGYYNYNHLILTRIRERNQMRYYIGVPGVFLEREKKTAVMFGFQSFECAVEPAQEGDFGYYMIPVEL